MPKAAVSRRTRSGVSQESRKKLPLRRLFTKEGRHPFDDIQWKRVCVTVRGSGMNTTTEERELEFPEAWSDNATSIAGSKYFRGRIGSHERETSVRQMISRVVGVIRGWGLKFGYFDTPQEADVFADELTHVLLHQKAAFNSPVWFNVGVEDPPQCSACQPYRALVSAPSGFYPIGEIVEKNMVGLPVYDSQGITQVVAVKDNGVKQVYKITLRNGTQIEATGDHLVKAVLERRTEPQWVRVDELYEGMRLHLHPHREIAGQVVASGEFSIPAVRAVGTDMLVCIKPLVQVGLPTASIEASEAALAGWLQADGFVGQYNHGTNRSLTTEYLAVTDEERQWIQWHLNAVFPNVHQKVCITETKQGTRITRIRLYGEVLRGFVEEYGLLARREHIRVPEKLWKSGPDAITAYVKSVFQAEGYVTVNGASVHVAIATISEQWMHDIQTLLYGLGIYSRIRVKKEKRENRMNTFELDISAGSERKTFADRIGFLSHHKQEKLLASVGSEVQKNIPDVREEEILAIEQGIQEQVYDIQTASGEYLSNHVVVHNCFILAVEDNMESILDWIYTEGIIFKRGSGAGVNLSPLRSSVETLSAGGRSSGPVSFMRGGDAVAGMIASGGSTRRAAKMVVMNIDHPDIMKFIHCKAEEEKKVHALIQSGYNMYDLNNPAWNSIQYQNANNSVRVTDEFMHAVENDEVFATKLVQSGKVAQDYRARDLMHEIAKAAWESGDPGMQYDTTINRWHTAANTGRINASNPCSEYMHMDNSACNLASINVLKYLKSDGSFNVRGFVHTVDVMILAQEIIVDGSRYPTEKIAKNSHDFRQLGLGYANLGALLMTWGLPYDSEGARHTAAAITALTCGEAYRYSGEIAKRMGPFEGFVLNREPMLNVIAMHGAAMDRVRRDRVMDSAIYETAKEAWDDALMLGKKYGLRNSQVTVIAPTGTIALMMDCATTGVEPEFALVKMKKLVGGGTMKFVNTSVSDALARLGYGAEEIASIVEYLEKNGAIEGAPGIKDEHLAVFDCAVRPTAGRRSISWQGHVKMVAAVQPFISGAISKTFNMPSETTVEEIMQAYMMGWKLGLKAFAVYRDGSKAAQPLTTSGGETGKNKQEQKVMRKRLPAIRPSETHKFSIAGHEGYLTYSTYEDGLLAEIFIRMSKQGSTLAGLLDVFAIAVSIALQHGVPLKTLIAKFAYGRYEPSGYTDNPAIQVATSITDYIFRYLALRFLNDEDLAELGISAPVKEITAAGGATDKIEMVTNSGVSAASVQPEQRVGATTRPLVYADSVCRACGGMLIQTGTCKTCIQCGSSSGGC
ncbi:MAG: vitamin B12-dependent ribonucleotide reductase [Candidatus Sungbacteria bacterium]|nr:vitamin B12-dependent ribonucleotide reductase [Candidatus Sungbacteria bacterium]